jgi:hypothetical protein
LDIFWPTHPLCKHDLCTEHKQKRPFFEPTHPVLHLRNIWMVPSWNHTFWLKWCFENFLFSSEMTMNWLFLRIILWNMLCLLCNTTQAADNNKDTGLKFFQKQPVFCNFWWKKEILKTLFQPKSLWNGSVAFSLG